MENVEDMEEDQMSHVWETPHGCCMLKLERAKKHIEEFSSRLLSSPDRHATRLLIDNDTGEHLLYYESSDHLLPGELAGIIGDALHNIRSALDIAWVNVVKEMGAKVTSKTKFPVRADQSRKWLEGALPENAGVHPGSNIWRFMVDHVQPYQGGDSDILALHSLDIYDKHELLIPTIFATGIDGIELENEDGTVDVFSVDVVRGLPNRLRPTLGSKFKNYGVVTFDVKFGQGTLAQRESVAPFMSRLSSKVFEICLQLQIGVEIDKSLLPCHGVPSS